MIYNYKHSINNLKGTVENYIVNELKQHGTLCFPLIDSENFLNASSIAKKAELMGASGILVGGSSAVDQLELAEIVSSIKSQIKIPVILFPGNITGIAPKLMLFSSVHYLIQRILTLLQKHRPWEPSLSKNMILNRCQLVI